MEDEKPILDKETLPETSHPRRNRGLQLGVFLALLLGLAGVFAPLWSPLTYHFFGFAPLLETELTRHLDEERAEVSARFEELQAVLAGIRQKNEERAGLLPDPDKLASRAALEEVRKVQAMLGKELNKFAATLADAGGNQARGLSLVGTRLDAVSAELGVIPGQIEEMRVRLHGVDNELRPAFNAARRSLAEIRNDLAEFGANVAKLQHTQDALRARLDLLAADTARAARLQTGMAALLVSVGQLRTRVGEGSFVEALNRVKAVARQVYGEQIPAELALPLSDLEPIASFGVPSLDLLRRRLDSSILALAKKEQQDTGPRWLNRTLARLREPIVIRPRGAVARGTGLAVLAARAEVLFSQGDLAGAVDSLRDEKALRDGSPSLADWLNDARLRLSLDRALTGLDSWVAGQLGRIEAEAS